MTVREGFNGLVTSKLTAEVNKGERYNLKIRAISTDIVIEGRYNTDEKNDLYLNGWKLDGNISTAVGIQEVNATTEALDLTETHTATMQLMHVLLSSERHSLCIQTHLLIKFQSLLRRT